jgi:Mn2+/Fe2+ NRAMP family transporter
MSESGESKAVRPVSESQVENPYARSADSFKDPPKTFLGTLKHLGPGMILVGSIVGSGELIMTTKLGAEVGFLLLWFILASCFLKVVVQAELVRHTISSGKTFLDVYNSLPGPGHRRPVWMTRRWMALVLVGFVVGVAYFSNIGPDARLLGVRSAIWIPLLVLGFVVAAAAQISKVELKRREPTERPRVNWFMWVYLVSVLLMYINGGAIVGGAGQAVELIWPDMLGSNGSVIWTIVVAIGAAAILLSGGYNVLERVSIGLVFTFTLITIGCTVLLQWTGYAVTWDDIRSGLEFRVFPNTLMTGLLASTIVMTALAAYAGTGIGHYEMITYTYWCVEKGYARNAGECVPGDDWPQRARGWVKVMYTDVFMTMIVYTVSTICFYFLGAAILHQKQIDPDAKQTLSTLQEMYTSVIFEVSDGVLASWAATGFIVGAFFVLFSTVLAGAAGGARLLTDAMCVLRLIDPADYPARQKSVRVLICVSLGTGTVMYSLFANPPLMLMIASLVSVIFYPALALGTLWLRHRGVDERIRPSMPTTVFLWICGILLALISPLVVVYALALKNGWVDSPV